MEVPRQREWVITQAYYSHYIFTKEREDIVLLPSHASNGDGECPHARLLHTLQRCVYVCACVCFGFGVMAAMAASNKSVDV